MFTEYNYLKEQRKSIQIKNSKPHSNKLPHNSYILIIPKNVVQLSRCNHNHYKQFTKPQSQYSGKACVVNMSCTTRLRKTQETVLVRVKKILGILL